MCKKPYFIRKQKMYVSCGQCMSCKLKKAKEWSIRSIHEKSDQPASFVTLTYATPNLPNNRSLCYKHVQLLFRNLRKNYEKKFKYLVCGEYGPKTARPHYHIIFIGVTNDDIKELFEHHKVWKYGYVHIGYSVNSRTCAYIAQYTVKKLRKETYGYDRHTKSGREPPFIHSSKGFGKAYALNNSRTFLKRGYFKLEGKRYAIPRYYFKVLGIDRAEYYTQFINTSDADMVGEAHLAGITALYPENYFNALPANLKDTLHEQREGRFLYIDNKWRVTTLEFLKFRKGIRAQYDLQLKTRYKDSRQGAC